MKIRRKPAWRFAAPILLVFGISSLSSLKAETLDTIYHYGNAKTQANGGTASANAASPDGIALGNPHGFTNPAADTYTITTGGQDLWGGSDHGSVAFDSTASPREGDFSAIVRCRVGETGEVLASGGWGRTGIMARKNPTAANSANFAHYRRSDGAQGSVIGIRASDGAGTSGNAGADNHGNGAATVPHQTTWIWLGLHRKGSNIMTSWAPDDAGSPGAWSEFKIRLASRDLRGPLHIGLAHQNHNTAGLHNSGPGSDGGRHISTATFEQFQVFGEFRPEFGTGLPTDPILPPFGTIVANPGGPGTFGVREIIAPGGNIIQTRDALLADTGGMTAQLPILDVTDPDTNANGGPVLGGTPTPYLNDAPGDTNDMKTIATGKLNVQQTGHYTFNFHGDDGFAARVVGVPWGFVGGAGQIDIADPTTVYFFGGTGDHNTQAEIYLEAGIYDFEYVNWEGGGGAYYEVSTHSGRLGNGEPGNWLPLGACDVLPGFVVAGPSLVGLSGPVDVAKLNGGTGGDPGGGEGASPSRFSGPNGNDGIRAQIQAAIDGGDPNLNQNTHPDTLIAENQTPNPAQNDNYRLRVTGEFVIDDGDATPGESLDLTFTIRNDDGGQLRILGQDFTATAGDGRTFLEDIDGDMALTADFFTGNTNALGHITLTEGVYPFEAYMYEGGGGSRFEVQASPGHVGGFGGSFFVPSFPIPDPIVIPDNHGIPVGAPELVISTGLPPQPYSQDFEFPDGTTDLGDGSVIGASDGINQVLGGQLRLTDSLTAGTRSSFRVPALPNSSSGWHATFDYVLTHDPGHPNPDPADGFSFNYGAIPARAGNGPGPDQDGAAEEGWGGGIQHISFEADTWRNGDAEQGFNVAVNGTDVAGGFLGGTILPSDGAISGTVEIWWDPSTTSFTTTGGNINANFIDLAHGFTGDDGYGFGISARTGGATETLLIDNLVIQTGGEVDTEIASGTCIDFGITRRDVPATKDFVVANTGSEDLIFTGLDLPTDWSLVGTPPAPVPAGGSTTVTLQFDGTGPAGDRTGTIVLLTNDCDESPFEIDVKVCLDDEGPVITGFKDIVTNAPAEGLSEPIEWTLSVSDNKDPAPVLVCTPPSGTQFPIGDNEVVCTATDHVGNETTITFYVSVLEIAETPGERFLDVVSLRGDEALGAGGGNGVAAGATIFTFYSAFINNNGDAVVNARLSDATRALYKADSTGLSSLVAATGTASPFGGNYDGFEDEAIADDGVVSFSSTIAGVGNGHVTDDGTTGAAVVGDPAPGTDGVFRSLKQPASAGAAGLFSPGLATGGTVTVRNDSGIWSSGAGLLVREGDAAVGFGATDLHGHVTNRVVANEAGNIAFSGAVLTRPTSAAVWAGDPGALAVAAQKGAPAPGTPGVFRSFLGESIGGGGEIAIRANISGGGIGSTNNEGIWTGTPGSTLSLVAREGDVAPCLPTDDVLFSRFTTMHVADDGTVCFFAFLTGPGVNSSNDGSFWRSDGNALQLIVREGSEANNTDGGIHKRITSIACNSTGGVVYTSTLVRGIGDTVGSNDSGLWLDEGPDRAAELVLRRGDSFELGENERAIAEIAFEVTANAAGGTGGYGRIINDAGQGMLRLSLDGNLSGLFILGEEPEDEEPEPPGGV